MKGGRFGDLPKQYRYGSWGVKKFTGDWPLSQHRFTGDGVVNDHKSSPYGAAEKSFI